MAPTFKIMVYGIMGIGIMIFFGVTPGPEGAVLAAFFDSGHAVIFGLLSWIGLGIWRAATPRERKWEGYAVVFLSLIALGILSEVLQIFGSRRAEVLDVVRDVSGTVAFMLLAFGWEGGTPAKRRAWVTGVSAVLLFITFLPPLALSGAYAWRARGLPNLVSYHSVWAKPLWGVRNATVSLEVPPGRFPVTTKRVAKVTFLRGDYPRLVLGHPAPDWEGFRTFAFDVYSDLDSTRVLNLRIHDKKHHEDVNDRFNYRFTVHPGTNKIRIAMRAIERAPATRIMDLKNMAGVVVFAVRPPEPYTLYFSPFRLE